MNNANTSTASALDAFKVRHGILSWRESDENDWHWEAYIHADHAAYDFRTMDAIAFADSEIGAISKLAERLNLEGREFLEHLLYGCPNSDTCCPICA